MITDQAIKRVMDVTGMEPVQAHRLLRDRAVVQQLDDDRRRAAANLAVTNHAAHLAEIAAEIEPFPFRPIGELIREIVADFLIIEDPEAFERSMATSMELKPGGVCRVEGLRKWDWIDRLSPDDALYAIRAPISRSRKMIPFPISREEFARLKARAYPKP
jgi:hypothetical protein